MTIIACEGGTVPAHLLEGIMNNLAVIDTQTCAVRVYNGRDCIHTTKFDRLPGLEELEYLRRDPDRFDAWLDKLDAEAIQQS